MGEALFDLEQILRSKKDQITSQEANIIMTCKAQVVRDFSIGVIGATVVTWLATWKLHRLYRTNLTLGAAAVAGMWKVGTSLDSCVDHILSLEGTRIKNEMAKIVLTKYQNDPSIMQRISRHFYSENVYDESSVEKPKLRWRVRNYFCDYSDIEKMRVQHDGSNDEKIQGITDSDITSMQRKHLIQKSMQQRQVYMNTSIDAMTDPFDCVFGLPVAIDETRQSDASTKSPRRHIRSQKRSHRRHLKRHLEMSDA